MVNFPKWTVWFTFAIIKLLDAVLGSVSNFTLSLAVNSFPFKNQDNLAFGKASTKHSNLIDWSWTITESLDALTNRGAPKYLKIEWIVY